MFPRTGSSDAPGCPPNSHERDRGEGKPHRHRRDEVGSCFERARDEETPTQAGEQHEDGDGAWKGVRCGSTMTISGCLATEDKSKETVRNPPTGAQTRSAETQ